MAKPIRATPHLHGNAANKFLKKMEDVENSKISFVDKKISKSVKKFINL